MVADKFAGKKGRCPTCKAVGIIPEQAEANQSESPTAQPPPPTADAAPKPKTVLPKRKKTVRIQAVTTPPGGANTQDFGIDIPGAVVYKGKEERYIGRLLQNVKAREAHRKSHTVRRNKDTMITRLSNLLISKDLSDQETIQKAVENARQSGATLISCLKELDAVSEQEIGSAISEEANVLFSTSNIQFVDDDAKDIMSLSDIKRFQAIPLKKTGHAVRIAMVNPLDEDAIEAIKTIVAMDVRPMVCTETSFYETLKEYYE